MAGVPDLHSHKGDKTEATDPQTETRVPLFNPRLHSWWDHFSWADDGLRINGRTPTGRATVIALHLSDDPDSLIVRSYWVQAGWHLPRE